MSKEYYTETENIFGAEKRPFALSNQNLGDLLRSASEGFRGEISNHYGARSGANDYTAGKIGALVTTPNERLQGHAGYLKKLYQKEFEIYTPEHVKEITKSLQPGEKKPLIIPYFNSYQVEKQASELGADLWGLPAQLTEAFKNKVNFHNLAEKAGIEGFEVPEYRIADKEDYVHKAFDLLTYSQNLYKKHGLANRYPLGVMVRLEESDGNYGSSLVRQEKDGRISITPDGESDNTQYAKTWEEALTLSRDSIYHKDKVDPNQTPQVVISRYLDLEDSPGLSLIFVDGQAHSLGWNGQLQLNGSKACIGTSSYHPEDPYLQKAQKDYEKQSGAALADFVVTVAKDTGIDHRNLNGAINADFMVYGELEQELRSNQNKKPGVYVAEINPRWTNYTDAIMAVIGATDREPTVKNMRSVIQEGIYTEDKVDLGIPSIDEKDSEKVKEQKQTVIDATTLFVREIIASQDSRDKTDRVIVRMPDQPLGAIYTGDKTKSRKELKTAIESANTLLTMTIFSLFTSDRK